MHCYGCSNSITQQDQPLCNHCADKAIVDLAIERVNKLQFALVNLLESCEENSCEKSINSHCDWCAPGWKAVEESL